MNIVGVLSGKRKCLLAIAIAFSTFGNAQLVTYPEGLNTGMPHNDDYTVKVREAGGEWKDVFEYEVQVDMDWVQSASMVQFDIGSPVEVMVKKNNGTIQDVKIRPLAIGIQHTVNHNAIFLHSLDLNACRLSLTVIVCIIFICLLILWKQKLILKAVTK